MKFLDRPGGHCFFWQVVPLGYRSHKEAVLLCVRFSMFYFKAAAVIPAISADDIAASEVRSGGGSNVSFVPHWC